MVKGAICTSAAPPACATLGVGRVRQAVWGRLYCRTGWLGVDSHLFSLFSSCFLISLYDTVPSLANIL